MVNQHRAVVTPESSPVFQSLPSKRYRHAISVRAIARADASRQLNM